MKRLLVLAIALMVISAPAFAQQNLVVNGDFATLDDTGWTRWNSSWGVGFDWDFSNGYAQISCSGGSFGLYQAITVTPGKQYEINAIWMGNGSSNWVEVLFFNDDGRSMLDQCDAPHDASIITKVDGWGMNGGMPFKSIDGNVDFGSIADGSFWYTKGLKTNVITATSSTMYVVLKTGANGGETMAAYDDVSVVEVVPEPASMLALVAGLGGLIIRRKR